jgi:hypothetical protein
MYVYIYIYVYTYIHNFYYKIMQEKHKLKKLRKKIFPILAMWKPHISNVTVLHLAAIVHTSAQLMCCINPALTGHMYIAKYKRAYRLRRHKCVCTYVQSTKTATNEDKRPISSDSASLL